VKVEEGRLTTQWTLLNSLKPGTPSDSFYYSIPTTKQRIGT
jgi:hypothetical protein